MKAIVALLLVVACWSAQAGVALPDQTYKDWYAGQSGSGYTMAMTVNADGRILGQFCYQNDKHCEWRMGLDTACKPGEQGLILINGDSVFSYSSITCIGLLGSGKSLYTYKIENWRSMEDIITSGSRVSICIPIHETQFAVYRFSTLGAVEASAYMGGPIVGERHSQQEILTRDTTL